jgi:TonB dependent receptor/Carboxypeptidase regulatory-like domain/TonB-dependent Receptor Plug Domain
MQVRNLLIVLTVVLFGGALSAQETTGRIAGRVLDAQNLAVPGATVTATGLQGSKAAATDADGRFTLPFLTPGVYSVRAELQGFKAFEQKGVAVGLGQTVEVPIKMEVGAVAETVNITAASPIIDMTSTTAGAVISSDLLENIPVGRRLADTLYLAPGTSSSSTAGHMNPSMSGGSGLDNLYVIDGVNVTSAGYGGLGSYSTTFGSLGNATPFDFVKEIQVKTAGYEAEFGQSMGGVVNVVTKSGSNEIRGSVFGYTRPESLEGTWTQVQTPNGTVQTLGSHNYDSGAEGGAPIIRNRLFFFGAIDPARDVQTYQAPQGFPLLSLGGVDRIRDAVSYSAKVTYQVNSAHRIDASFFGDPSNGLDGPQRPGALLGTTTQQFSTLAYGGHNQTVRYDGVVSSHWLVEAYYSRALNNINETPDADTWQVRDTTVTPNVRSGGLGYYEPGNHGLNNQYAVKATNVIAAHEIKYGFEYDHANWNQLISYTGPTFTAPNGQQTATGASIQIIPDSTYGQIYRVVRANFTPGASTTQSYQDFFVQDTWRVGSRLTVNPGVRFEQETLNGNAVSGFSLGNNWAPRIGATFDPNGDGKTKIFGNWGRFYSRVPNDLAARALSAETGISRADYLDAGLTQPVPGGIFLTNGATAGDAIDPNAKMSYINEYLFGVEREIMPDTSLGVRFIHRDIGRMLEDVANCPSAGAFVAETADICGNVSYILTNPSSATPVNAAAIAAFPAFADVSFADPVHTYNAVEVTLNRRLSHNWSGMASYRWSRLRGNYEGFYRDDNGQSDPGISSLYDFPQNDPTFTSIGVPQAGFQGDIRYLGDPNGILPLDRPNQIKLFGNYIIGNLNLGVGFNGGSGAPLTPLAANPNYGNGGEIPTAPRGSGIQTVNGFLMRTPFTTQVDFQASYNLKMGGARRLTLLADIFNLFDQQTVLNYDTWTALTFGGPANPNFGQPTSEIIAGPQIQAPRQIRLGARFQF